MKLPKNFWQDHGHRLRVTRIALGISEQEAADAWGVALRTYKGYEAGKPSREDGLINFASKYGVSIDWLCGVSGASLPNHLTKNSAGKVAILPTMQPTQRRHLGG